MTFGSGYSSTSNWLPILIAIQDTKHFQQVFHVKFLHFLTTIFKLITRLKVILLKMWHSGLVWMANTRNCQTELCPGNQLGHIIISSVNHPCRTLAALQTPKVWVLNLPLTRQAVTRVSGSSGRCHNRAASCQLAGGGGKQHTQKTKTALRSMAGEKSQRGVSLNACVCTCVLGQQLPTYIPNINFLK